MTTFVTIYTLSLQCFNFHVHIYFLFIKLLYFINYQSNSCLNQTRPTLLHQPNKFVYKLKCPKKDDNISIGWNANGVAALKTENMRRVCSSTSQLAIHVNVIQACSLDDDNKAAIQLCGYDLIFLFSKYVRMVS